MKSTRLATAALLATSFVANTAHADDGFFFSIGNDDFHVEIGDRGPRPRRQYRVRRPRQPTVTIPQQFDPPPQFDPQPQYSQNLPKVLQGTWYEVSSQNTRYVYNLRASDYDMYEVDPSTNRVLMGQDGQPVQLLREPLTYSNGVLTLSPGPDQDGPLMISGPPPQYPRGRTMTPLAGGPVRYFTRRPVRIRATTTTPAVVKGHNVKSVSYKMQGQRSTFTQTSNGIWTESNPEETATFTETGRDEWSVYLTRTDGAVSVQLDLYRKMIRVDGRDTHRIDQAF